MSARIELAKIVVLCNGVQSMRGMYRDDFLCERALKVVDCCLEIENTSRVEPHLIALVFASKYGAALVSMSDEGIHLTVKDCVNRVEGEAIQNMLNMLESAHLDSAPEVDPMSQEHLNGSVVENESQSMETIDPPKKDDPIVDQAIVPKTDEPTTDASSNVPKTKAETLLVSDLPTTGRQKNALAKIGIVTLKDALDYHEKNTLESIDGISLGAQEHILELINSALKA